MIASSMQLILLMKEERIAVELYTDHCQLNTWYALEEQRAYCTRMNSLRLSFNVGWMWPELGLEEVANSASFGPYLVENGLHKTAGYRCIFQTWKCSYISDQAKFVRPLAIWRDAIQGGTAKCSIATGNDFVSEYRAGRSWSDTTKTKSNTIPCRVRIISEPRGSRASGWSAVAPYHFELEVCLNPVLLGRSSRDIRLDRQHRLLTKFVIQNVRRHISILICMLPDALMNCLPHRQDVSKGCERHQ